MQTNLAPEFKGTREGQEAEAILRKCVHCGFCTATCPTYQLLGDELDSPRGRIYLMKQVLEGAPVTRSTQLHLDRCLTCRNCETTCPSGVQYGRLLDIGRTIVERKVGRTKAEAAQRWGLRRALLSGGLFSAAVSSARLLKGLLPRELGDAIMGCVDKDPARRPDSLAPLLELIRRVSRTAAAGATPALATLSALDLRPLAQGVLAPERPFILVLRANQRRLMGSLTMPEES
jgi:heterodisulfide reductase subunit C